jgi:NIMA (never in mitosis gene a)-related kinase
MSIFQSKRKKNYSSSNYIREYKIVSKIGEGSYAKIFKVQKDNSNIIYVLKQIPITEEDYKDPKNLEEILNESKILSSLHSNYILKYYDSFIYDNNLIIITEYCSYGDLCDYLMMYINKDKKLTEKLIWKIFIQISLGLYYLHNQKILHRDIKTKNIFLKENFAVKIGDLGIAKILNNTNSFATTFIGTPYYLSPEIVKNSPYSFKTDVWSLGVLLYQMCALKMPFDADSLPNLSKKILKAEYKDIPNIYSKNLKDLISSLLQIEPKNRPTVKEILSKIFFNNI